MQPTCPKCGSHLLYRYNNEIMCINCDWHEPVKPEDEIQDIVPEFHKMKDAWHY